MGYKVNKRYVGTNLVRPNKYEYSYDFRGKTTTQVTNDGWTLGSGMSIDSYGIKGQNWVQNTKDIPFSITNSKKIILYRGLYNANNANKLLAISGENSSQSSIYLGRNYDGRWTAKINGTEVQWLTSKSSPSGQSEVEFTLDFENLTWECLYYGTTMNGTFTQSAADNMRNNLDKFRFFMQYGDGALQYVKLVSYN